MTIAWMVRVLGLSLVMLGVVGFAWAEVGGAPGAGAGAGMGTGARISGDAIVAEFTSGTLRGQISYGYLVELGAIQRPRAVAVPGEWGALTSGLRDTGSALSSLARRAAVNRAVTLHITRTQTTGISRGAVAGRHARAYLAGLWEGKHGPREGDAAQARLAVLWKAIGWDRATWTPEVALDEATLTAETVVLRTMASSIRWGDVVEVATDGGRSGRGAPAANAETLRDFVDSMLIWRDARSLALESFEGQRALDVREDADMCAAWLARSAGGNAEVEIARWLEAVKVRLVATKGEEAALIPVTSRRARKGYPMPTIKGRETWEAGPAMADRMTSQGTIRWITVHHAGEMEDGKRPAPVKIKNLQTWGMREKKWGDVPYHWQMDLSGTLYACRELHYAGDTNTAYNPLYHALPCVMGNYEVQEFSEGQRESLVELCAWLCSEYGLRPDQIRSHRDWADTLCPGENLWPLVASGELSREVAARLEGKGLLESAVEQK